MALFFISITLGVGLRNSTGLFQESIASNIALLLELKISLKSEVGCTSGFIWLKCAQR